MKAATQSETLWNYDPNLAVDGDSNTCSFTPQSDVQRWWQVKMMVFLKIDTVHAQDLPSPENKPLLKINRTTSKE